MNGPRSSLPPNNRSWCAWQRVGRSVRRGWRGRCSLPHTNSRGSSPSRMSGSGSGLHCMSSTPQLGGGWSTAMDETGRGGGLGWAGCHRPQTLTPLLATQSSRRGGGWLASEKRSGGDQGGFAMVEGGSVVRDPVLAGCRDPVAAATREMPGRREGADEGPRRLGRVGERAESEGWWAGETTRGPDVSLTSYGWHVFLLSH
jgi:hypothetical protein